MEIYLRTHVLIDLDALEHNVNEMKKHLAPDVKTAAIVKADAYGHGAVSVSTFLDDKVDYFAVATADEALELHKNGITKPILLLSYTSPIDFELLLGKNIAMTVYTYENAKALSDKAVETGFTADVHIAVDTGMTRIGFDLSDESVDTVISISKLPNLNVCGIFSHYACADSSDKASAYIQTENYKHFIERLENRGLHIPIRHLCNSAGITEFDEHFDMVRMGIDMYGLYPSEEIDKSRIDLMPVMSFRSHIIAINNIPKGTKISYGHTFETKRDSRIAVVSVGYADGYPRSLSNSGKVIVKGCFAPIVGRICMDQFMIDITDIDGVEIEDEVTLIGSDGDLCISAEDIAAADDTINYEIICRISRRVPRVYKLHGHKFKIMSYLSGRIDLE